MSAIYLFLMGLAMLFLYPLHTPNFIGAGMMILVYGSFFQILGFPFFYILIKNIGQKQ